MNRKETEDVYMSMTRGNTNNGSADSNASAATENKASSAEEYSIVKKDCINILYEEDGSQITETIQSKLSQEKYKFNINTANLSEDKILPFSNAVIILLTPNMLETLRSYDNEHYSSFFQRGTVTILLRHYSVDKNDDVKVDELSTKYKDYETWKKIEMDQSKYGFKKVLLDIIQTVESSNKDGPPPPPLKICSIIPQTVWSCQDQVMIYFTQKAMSGDVTLAVLRDNNTVIKEYRTKRLTQTLFVVTPNGLPDGKKRIQVRVEGRTVAHGSLHIKCKMEILSEVLNATNNPLEFLCQALRIDDGNRDSLDMEMADMLSDGQQGINRLEQMVTIGSNSSMDNTKLELPTLLHLGAKYGLTRFCTRLMEYAWSRAALSTRNKDGKIPHELAKYAGHSDLAYKLFLKSSRGGRFSSSDEDTTNNTDGLRGNDQQVNDSDSNASGSVIQIAKTRQVADERSDKSDVFSEDYVMMRPQKHPPLPVRDSNNSGRSTTSSKTSWNSGNDSSLAGEWSERMTMIWDDIDDTYSKITYRGESTHL